MTTIKELENISEAGSPLCREAFEKWYTDKPGCPSVAKVNGEYVLMQAHAAWLSWRAAWNTSNAISSDLVRVIELAHRVTVDTKCYVPEASHHMRLIDDLLAEIRKLKGE